MGKHTGIKQQVSLTNETLNKNKCITLFWLSKRHFSFGRNDDVMVENSALAVAPLGISPDSIHHAYVIRFLDTLVSH